MKKKKKIITKTYKTIYKKMDSLDDLKCHFQIFTLL